MRLVDGDNEFEGRVEVYHGGKWGTVCDDHWDNQDARVVCRSLGLSGGVGFRDAQFGEGSDPIWMDGVTCLGSETNLNNCGHDVWGEHNCGHSEDAGVKCGKNICKRGGGGIMWECLYLIYLQICQPNK